MGRLPTGEKEKELADKPGSVEDNHSSGMRVATHLKRPTRKHMWATCAAQIEICAACLPIWSCSRRGLPCHRVLPPARCALTAPFHPYLPPPVPSTASGEGSSRRRGGLLSVALSVGSRPPGVTWRLALGARTFLHACAQRLPGQLRREWWGFARGQARKKDGDPAIRGGRRIDRPGSIGQTRKRRLHSPPPVAGVRRCNFDRLNYMGALSEARKHFLASIRGPAQLQSIDVAPSYPGDRGRESGPTRARE